MSSKAKKIAATATALVLSASLLLGGTYAWQSVNQVALNEASDVINPGGRLHNDLNYTNAKETNSDVYVENFAEEPIFARVRLEEYMEVVMNHGVEGAEIVETVAGKKFDAVGNEVNDKATEKNIYTYEYALHYFHQPNVTDEYWTWTMGEGESGISYMPTFNKNKDSLEPDLNGLYVDRVGGISNRGTEQYEEYVAYAEGDPVTKNAIYDADSNTADELKENNIELAGLIDGTAEYTGSNVTLVNEEHIAARVAASNGFISMADWLAKGDDDKADYWVYDDDGWVYWSSPIPAHGTTGLLLDSFTLNQVMDDTWYYAINVVGQFVTADDVGKADGTGFYSGDKTNYPNPSAEAETLLKEIGVVIGDDAGGEDENTPGEGGDDSGEENTSPSYTITDADGNELATGEISSSSVNVNLDNGTYTVTLSNLDEDITWSSRYNTISKSDATSATFTVAGEDDTITAKNGDTKLLELKVWYRLGFTFANSGGNRLPNVNGAPSYYADADGIYLYLYGGKYTPSNVEFSLVNTDDSDKVNANYEFSEHYTTTVLLKHSCTDTCTCSGTYYVKAVSVDNPEMYEISEEIVSFNQYDTYLDVLKSGADQDGSSRFNNTGTSRFGISTDSETVIDVSFRYNNGELVPLNEQGMAMALDTANDAIVFAESTTSGIYNITIPAGTTLTDSNNTQDITISATSESDENLSVSFQLYT